MLPAPQCAALDSNSGPRESFRADGRSDDDCGVVCEEAQRPWRVAGWEMSRAPVGSELLARAPRAARSIGAGVVCLVCGLQSGKTRLRRRYPQPSRINMSLHPQYPQPLRITTRLRCQYLWPPRITPSLHRQCPHLLQMRLCPQAVGRAPLRCFAGDSAEIYEGWPASTPLCLVSLTRRSLTISARTEVTVSDLASADFGAGRPSGRPVGIFRSSHQPTDEECDPRP
jgi:hypothetical protein